MKLAATLFVTGLLAACASAPPQPVSALPAPLQLLPAAAERRVVPLVDHHAHLVSARAAAGAYPLPVSEVSVPADIAALLERRQRGWNDAAALAPLYTPDAVVLNSGNEDLPSWIRGRSEVAAYMASLFGRPHQIKPVAFRRDGRRALVAGYFHRPEIDRHFGHVLLGLVRGSDGEWLIDMESPTFPGPPGTSEFDANALVKQLDDAGVGKAVVLSVAYWFGSSFRSLPSADEHAAVRAENDWVADQVSSFPDRLIGFCSVNPLKPYALAEVRRCGEQRRHRGLKLHMGNSDVDLRKPEHSRAVAAVLAEANRHGLSIAIHLWTDPSFETEGSAHARAFLDHVLPSAPDVPVQVAHLAGGGRATQPALQVFADAIAAGDPRTRNLYFDISTAAAGESPQNLRLDAEQMRRIGLDRILFGSDTSRPERLIWQAWPALHALPLTDGEFRRIARNVAPYLRDGE